MMKENAEVAVREMLKEIAIKVKVRFCINNTYVIIIMMDIIIIWKTSYIRNYTYIITQ